MVLVFVRRSHWEVPGELVTLISRVPRVFLSCLMMVGWQGKDAVKEEAVDSSCLLIV